MSLFRNSKWTRRLTGIVCLWMLIVLACSSLYLVAEADHDCCGQEDCPICACMEQCEQLLSHVCHGLIACSAVLLLASFVLSVAAPVVPELFHETLVSQNVRMNN